MNRKDLIRDIKRMGCIFIQHGGQPHCQRLKVLGQTDIVTRTRRDLDLLNQQAVMDFMQDEKPDQVYLAAAKVGGIHANNTYPAEFIKESPKPTCTLMKTAL